jgi:hypothetical protein
VLIVDSDSELADGRASESSIVNAVVSAPIAMPATSSANAYASRRGVSRTRRGTVGDATIRSTSARSVALADADDDGSGIGLAASSRRVSFSSC